MSNPQKADRAPALLDGCAIPATSGSSTTRQGPGNCLRRRGQARRGPKRLPGSGYFRAKMAQEKLIEDSSIPYSIVHATQLSI
jgi:hypothetical protein